MARHSPDALLAELDRLETLREPVCCSSTQRQFRRFVLRGDAELHPESPTRLDRTPVEVKLRDAGRGGCGFICQEKLAPGSTWRCCFMQHGYVVAEQTIMIRHCRQVSGNLYLVGAQFVLNTGLLTVLGVDPGKIDDADGDDLAEDSTSFLPPSEVA